MAMFTQWMANRVLTEKKVDVPDYSIDRWIKSASQLGSQVDSLVGQAKDKEKEADKEIEKKKKEKPPEKPKVEDKPEEEDQEHKEELPANKKAWNKLLDIAKERAEKAKKDTSHGRLDRNPA